MVLGTTLMRLDLLGVQLACFFARIFSMSALTDEEIKKIAKLGRLSLTDEEIKKLSKDLSAVLDYVAQLNELNTDGVEPMIGAINHSQENREDLAIDSGLQEKILANAPEIEGTAFKVPRMS